MSAPSNEEELCRRAIDMKLTCLSNLTDSLMSKANLKSSITLSFTTALLAILSLSLTVSIGVWNIVGIAPINATASILLTIAVLYTTTPFWGPKLVEKVVKKDLEEINTKLKKLENYCRKIDEELNDCWEKYCLNSSNNICRELKTLISP